VAPRSKPGYVVLRRIGADRWQLVGDVDRALGLTAKAARERAIEDATKGRAKPGDEYRAVLRSEWRIAGE
jgi:hypothetical protein